MLRTCAGAVVLAALVPAVARAAPPAYWGGGGVPDHVRQAGLSAHLGSWGVGLRRSEDGLGMDVRVSFAVRACGRHPADATDALVTADLAPDGTFHLKDAPAETDEFGKVLVTIDGTAVDGRADGTVSARTAWGCGLSSRPFTARQIVPGAPASGAAPAPADGMLYGITFQELGRAPHPVVFEVGSGGTVAHGFLTWRQTCSGRQGGRPLSETGDYQEVLEDRPIAAGAWSVTREQRESAARRRQGLRFRSVFVLEGAFDGATLRGTLQDRFTVRRGEDHESCAPLGAHGFAVVPA